MKAEIRNSVVDGLNDGGARFILFIRCQVREVQKGGLAVLLRKVGGLLALVPSVLLVLLVRAVRPVVRIRFGRLISGRIGHFAANTELYLCERDVGVHGKRTIDIFYHGSAPCNQQLQKMWERTLHVYRFARWLDRANQWLPDSEKHVVPMSSSWDIQGVLATTKVHLSFTPEEEFLGRKAMRELGISEGTPFICFHARDPSYLNTVHNFRSQEEWRYHNYRDSTIHNYIPAVEEMVHRGYFAIRTGAVVEEKLNTTNPRIVDYATNGRSNFLDIYLSAKCRFFICDTAGISSIPMIFRRPIAWVNYVPLELAPTWSASDLFIPKKLWLRKERRFLTFREVFALGAGSYTSGRDYEQLGIEVVENTPEEITSLAVEMDERLNGTWRASEEDEDLQQRFWSIFKSSELHRIFVSRIGTEFLRQNRELLD